MTIEEIQEECKKRFPIGCVFKNPFDNVIYTLKDGINTYNIMDHQAIDGGFGCGYLYYNKKFAELISLPKGYKVKIQSYNYLIKLFKKYGIK